MEFHHSVIPSTPHIHLASFAATVPIRTGVRATGPTKFELILTLGLTNPILGTRLCHEGRTYTQMLELMKQGTQQ